MANFREVNREQVLLLPPDLREWVPDDDLAHFVIAAVERVDIHGFKVNHRGTGKPQFHPRMMLALLIYGYANGVFSSRRLERATFRDVGVRFLTGDQHPDHDTIATFRRENLAAFEAAFVQVLLLARETGLLRVGMVSIDGTKIDANASKIRSVRHDRMVALREKLAADIAELTAKAEAADSQDAADPQALPEEIGRREALKAKLDAACERLEAIAREEHEAAKAEYARKKEAHEARSGRKGSPPTPPDDGPNGTGPGPRGDRQINLTDPDSQLMRKSARHEYRQAYNAQAVVDADGSQLILSTNVATTPTDQTTFCATILSMERTVGLPQTVLGDAGYASAGAVETLQAKNIEPLIAISGTQPHRTYDFRPPPEEPKRPRAITEPWRIAMKEKLESDDGKARYKYRKQTVEPTFGIIKSAMGFRQFSLRGIDKVKGEWSLVALAYNIKRLAKLTAKAAEAT